jgi:hypothetical protein
MKRTIQAFALFIALGATVQTLKAYAIEAGFISVEEEEGTKISNLIELRKDLVANDGNISVHLMGASSDNEIANITNEDELNEAIVKHILRYLQGIGAEKKLKEMLLRAEFQSFRGPDSPGI